MLGSILVSRTPIKSSRNSTDEEERKERFLHTKVEDGVVVMIVFQLNGSLMHLQTTVAIKKLLCQSKAI